MPDQNEGSGFDKFFISCSHASGTPCNVKKKNHKHCKLCGRIFDAPFHCEQHFNQSHVSGSLLYGGNPTKKTVSP